MKQQVFRISGMHCVSCALTIDLDLEELDGVISSRTSYAKQKTTVQYDERRINLPQIIESIRKSGYPATVQ